jgi:hypothetical protein
MPSDHWTNGFRVIAPPCSPTDSGRPGLWGYLRVCPWFRWRSSAMSTRAPAAGASTARSSTGRGSCAGLPPGLPASSATSMRSSTCARCKPTSSRTTAGKWPPPPFSMWPNGWAPSPRPKKRIGRMRCRRLSAPSRPSWSASTGPWSRWPTVRGIAKRWWEPSRSTTTRASANTPPTARPRPRTAKGSSCSAWSARLRAPSSGFPPPSTWASPTGPPAIGASSSSTRSAS